MSPASENNKSRPFFLYLSHFGVHTPLEAKKELIEKYRKKPGVGGPRLGSTSRRHRTRKIKGLPGLIAEDVTQLGQTLKDAIAKRAIQCQWSYG